MISIRTASESDAAAVAKIYKPYVETTAITFEYDAPDMEEMKKRIQTVKQHWPYLVAVEDGKVLGYAYASSLKSRPAYYPSVETSIYVDASHHQAGVGRALYTELEKELAKQDVTNLYACIAAPKGEDLYLNEDSIHFHTHMGYQIVGRFHNCALKFNRPYDVVWMEKII